MQTCFAHFDTFPVNSFVVPEHPRFYFKRTKVALPLVLPFPTYKNVADYFCNGHIIERIIKKRNEINVAKGELLQQ